MGEQNKWKGKGDIRENWKEEKMDNGIKWKAKGEKRKYRKEEEDGRRGGERKGKVKNLKPLFYEISGSPRES